MKQVRQRTCFWLLAMIVVSPIAWSAQDVSQEVLNAEQERIDAIARAIPPTVAIFSGDGNGGGSGVVISADGYALTNFHVVQPVGEYMKCGMADGGLYDALVVGIDPTGDVALIKLFGRDDFPTAEMADSDDVRVGDWCFAVGNPFLLATNFQPTVTYGIVSGTHRYQFPAGTILEYTDCIQTDAAINPGNSGGPLFNARGVLIGINGRGSFEKRGRVNVGLGYAISINQVKHFLGYLHSGRIVDHATLGATVVDDEDGRVVVSNILDSSDAYRRGLRYGDELLTFGGRPITSAHAFKNVLGIYPKGWRVPISFRRDGVRHDVHVRLPGVHAGQTLLEKIRQSPAPDKPPVPDKPQDKPGDGEEKPTEALEPEVGDVPTELQPFIKQRTGFANYYFNELNRDRVWSAFRDVAGDLAEMRDTWTVAGDVRGRGSLALRLDDKSARAVVGNVEYSLTDAVDLSEQLDPPGSGGMLAALHLWRRLLVEGPQRFGDVTYLGKAPLVGHPGLYDVLVGFYDVVETRFYFDPADGRIVAMELAPDPDVDPCEIYFSDYRDSPGGKLPYRWRVQVGDQLFADVEVQSYRLPNTSREEA